jgi:predicted RNA binding protein YcfA (HicA-like mRNA interferase family)
MPKRYTVRELIKKVETAGWKQVKSKGSHRQFKHDEKKGRVTIPGHLPEILPPKTIQSILDQAGLEE